MFGVFQASVLVHLPDVFHVEHSCLLLASMASRFSTDCSPALYLDRYQTKNCSPFAVHVPRGTIESLSL